MRITIHGNHVKKDMVVLLWIADQYTFRYVCSGIAHREILQTTTKNPITGRITFFCTAPPLF